MTAGVSDPHIGLVVEGAGDVGAIPVLLRSHLHARGEYRELLGKPVPVHGRENAVVAGGIEGYVATAASRPGCVAVLVVLDGEGDCVAALGPSLTTRGCSMTGKPVVVSLADKDFEDWIHASIETMELGDLEFDGTKRGQSVVKSALKPKSYAKPTWQPRLAARIDLALAVQRNASLLRTLTKLDELLTTHIP